MKISIITTTYNSGETLRNTLDSLLKQNYLDWECIIVDGGSTDNTLDIVREYELRFDGRMRWLSEPDIEDKIIYIIDNIINQLNKNKSLLTFISKNLSWGVFKTALTNPIAVDDINFSDVYHKMLEDAPYEFREPEVMLFLIVELVSGACYSSILYQEPCDLEQLKPNLYASIRLIIQEHKL